MKSVFILLQEMTNDIKDRPIIVVIRVVNFVV